MSLPDYAHTKGEWWEIVDAIWPDILTIFSNVGFDLNEANYAEEIGPVSFHSKPFAANMEEMKTERNDRLSVWLHRAWAAAPDLPSIHGWPSWSRFCDLCSESHVLENDNADR